MTTANGTPKYSEETACNKCGGTHAQLLTETMPTAEEQEEQDKKKKQLNE